MLQEKVPYGLCSVNILRRVTDNKLRDNLSAFSGNSTTFVSLCGYVARYKRNSAIIEVNLARLR